MIDLQSAIKQLQELAEEHHERASELSCVPFCYNGYVGGYMTKKLVEMAEKQLSGK